MSKLDAIEDKNLKPDKAHGWIFYCDKCGKVNHHAYLEWRGSHADWLCKACATKKKKKP